MGFYQPEKLPKLMVAPNGARKIKKDHPAVPLTIAVLYRFLLSFDRFFIIL